MKKEMFFIYWVVLILITFIISGASLSINSDEDSYSKDTYSIENYPVNSKVSINKWSIGELLFGRKDKIRCFKGYCNVYDCTELNISNNIYYLINDVESDGDCFDVKADNISFDGQNHLIEYAKTKNGQGFRVTNRDKITIKNAIVKQKGEQIPGFNHAIYLLNTNDSIIQNNVVQSFGGGNSPIMLTGGNNNVIFNNTINGKEGFGINIYSNSNNNLIKENNIDFDCIGIYSAPVGILFSGFPSYNNQLIGNKISLHDWCSGYAVGIWLLSATDNVFFDNNILINNGAPGSESIGIKIENSGIYVRNNSFINNSVYVKSFDSKGIFVQEMNNYFKDIVIKTENPRGPIKKRIDFLILGGDNTVINATNITFNSIVVPTKISFNSIGDFELTSIGSDGLEKAPNNYIFTGKFVNITKKNQDAQLSLVMHYTDQELRLLNILDERSLNIFQHRNEGWFASINPTRDLVNNTISTKITESMVVGLFGRRGISSTR